MGKVRISQMLAKAGLHLPKLAEGQPATHCPAYEDPQETLRLIQEMVSSDAPVLGRETQLKNGRAILVDFVPIVVDGQNQGRIWQHRDNTERKKIERERERLLLDLQETQSRISVLDGLLPICATCKKIRNDHGEWEQMEGYITRRSEAAFSHGICPDCAVGFFAELDGIGGRGEY